MPTDILCTTERIAMPDRSRPGTTTAAPLTDASQGGGDKCVTGLQEIRLKKDSLVIGTWNVCTLNHNRTDVLIHELERYKWDILGLCETRWKSFGGRIYKRRSQIMIQRG